MVRRLVHQLSRSENTERFPIIRLVVVVGEADLARRLERRFRRLAALSLSEPLFAEAEEARRRSIVVEAGGNEPDGPSLMRLLLRAGPMRPRARRDVPPRDLADLLLRERSGSQRSRRRVRGPVTDLIA